MKLRGRMLVLGSFCLCLLCSLCLVYGLEKNKLEEKRSKTEYVTNAEVSKLQYVMDTLLLKTQTLEMIVVENDGKVTDFDRIAEKLYDNPAIRSLQLAPGGVVSYVYPLEGNENAFVDLFHDPERATEAIEARDSGKLTLSGPYDLYQGGLGTIGRRPVYLESADGTQEFWGFTIIVLDLPEAFGPARLDMFIKEGFEYKLYRMHPDTNQMQVIDQSSREKLRKPVEISFPVPNGEWTFGVMPRGGWIRKQDIFLEIGIGVVVSLLCSFIVGFIIKLREQKNDLYLLSITDSLTGLQNYSSLMKLLGDYSKSRKQYTLFYMDLDGFKNVNDTFGHNAGNEVLVESARRLRQCFSGCGTVFRNGGDEFCAVLKGSYEEDFCGELQREIISSIELPFQVGEDMIRCGISIGHARFPQDQNSMEDIMKEADTRMYRMKLASRHCISRV